jgi:hypothetical protein
LSRGVHATTTPQVSLLTSKNHPSPSLRPKFARPALNTEATSHSPPRGPKPLRPRHEKQVLAAASPHNTAESHRGNSPASIVLMGHVLPRGRRSTCLLVARRPRRNPKTFQLTPSTIFSRIFFGWGCLITLLRPRRGKGLRGKRGCASWGCSSLARAPSAPTSKTTPCQPQRGWHRRGGPGKNALLPETPPSWAGGAREESEPRSRAAVGGALQQISDICESRRPRPPPGLPQLLTARRRPEGRDRRGMCPLGPSAAIHTQRSAVRATLNVGPPEIPQIYLPHAPHAPSPLSAAPAPQRRDTERGREQGRGGEGALPSLQSGAPVSRRGQRPAAAADVLPSKPAHLKSGC